MRAQLRLGVVAVTITLATAVALAQGPPATAEFEAASVKINTSGAAQTSLGFQQQSGRFRAVNEPLWRLIAEAYGTAYQLRRFEIAGIPGSIESVRFDIDTVSPPTATAADFRSMLQRLLADRFKLAVHTESREQPIYNLVTLRASGPLGERLTRSTTDCAAIRAAGQTPPLPANGGTRPCIMGFGRGILRASGLRIGDLADMGLARFVERAVIDRTGLTGPHEWTLEWAPDPLPGQALAGPADGVPLVTALQEQLGLRLEAGRGPVRMIVVDRVELPLPD